MKIAAYVLSLLSLILNVSRFVKLNPPYRSYFVSTEVMAAALSPFLVILGSQAVLGALFHSPVPFAAGLLAAAISIVYVGLVTVPQPGLAEASGKDWQGTIPPSDNARMSRRRRGLPKTKESHSEQNIACRTVPGTDRNLLCDVRQPPDSVDRSGLAFACLHGSQSAH